MGKRVHVIKKHEEYGSHEAFNWKFDEFHNFLDNLNCDVQAQDDYSEEFECEVTNYKKALDLLKTYKKKGLTTKVIKQLLNEYYSFFGGV